MRTNVYIDGFNLYYRAVKGTSNKWLDVSRLCQRLIPRDNINRIRYFTANALPRPNDTGIPARQQVYIRALKTIPNLSVHLGQFKRRPRTGRLIQPPGGSLPNIVQIEDFEEKGTDVNLATYLLVDGYEGDYEQALVISNDSDLALPIEMVKNKLGLQIVVVNPNRDSKNFMPVELSRAASSTRRIRESALQACQFPTLMNDASGSFRRPARW